MGTGQISQFGNPVYTQWKAGTIFMGMEYTIHLTWNGSWLKRSCLQLTGNATEETWNIVNNGSQIKYIRLMINTKYGADELAQRKNNVR